MENDPLKRWSPAARPGPDNSQVAYMIGDKEGRWTWSETAENRIRELEAKLASLDWSEISAENLPTMDDEVIRWRKDILGDFRQVLSVVDLFEWACTDYAGWTASGWTHRRPINAPKEAA